MCVVNEGFSVIRMLGWPKNCLITSTDERQKDSHPGPFRASKAADRRNGGFREATAALRTLHERRLRVGCEDFGRTRVGDAADYGSDLETAISRPVASR